MRRRVPLLVLFALAPLTLVAQTTPDRPAMNDAVTSTPQPTAPAPRLAPVALTTRRTSADIPAPTPAPRPTGFASSGFAQFMSSPAGRILRVVAGAGMIAGGIAADSDGGTVVAALGAVPLVAGTFDVCFLSPLFGGPFTGKAIRAAK